jgi:hypothetical protein
MAWIRGKQYLVEVLETSGNTLGLMVHGVLYGDHAFFDFSTRLFVQTQPAQPVQAIPLQVVPFIPGDVQRFVYVLDTHDFPDGDFAILYTDGAGRLLSERPAEFFSVYRGSPDMIVPPGA